MQDEDNRFIDELAEVYKSNAETDLRLSEELAFVSWETDQLAINRV